MALLQYVANQLKSSESLDLLVLKEMVVTMTVREDGGRWGPLGGLCCVRHRWRLKDVMSSTLVYQGGGGALLCSKGSAMAREDFWYHDSLAGSKVR